MIHAQITPEAIARIRAQKRNSLVAAIILAMLALLLLGLLFYMFKVFVFSEKAEPMVTYVAEEIQEEEVEQQKVTTTVQKQPASPSSSTSAVIVATAASPFSIPSPDIVVDSPAPEFGSSEGFGDGFGEGSGSGFGNGSGSGFTALPTSMKKRCDASERMQRLKEMGGTAQCEEAVVKALRWLKKTQGKDASWVEAKPVAMTGLALLAFLGHCETPLSPEFGEAVEAGIVYLVGKSVKEKGKLGSDFADHHWVYEHAIATYALAEAYTFCNIIGYEIEGLEQAVMLSAKVIIEGQSDIGTWNYSFDRRHRSDLSVGAWCMQALKAAKHTGLKINRLESCAKLGIEGVLRNQSSYGFFGYTSNKAHLDRKPTLTGAGLLCLQQWKRGKTANAKKALEWMSNNTEFKWRTPSAEIYGHYYNAQAFMEAGGQEWKTYNELFREQVLGGQNADGSFQAPGGKGAKYNGGDALGRHYRTCLCTLMLEVYYRFLPGTAAGK